MSERAFDLVVFGATGFTGRFVAQHLARSAPPGAKLAIAGRDEGKLRAIAGTLGREVGVLRADVGEPASLAALAQSARVVCTTVGPFQRFGLPQVEACARAGTHLCDINGEVLYMRDAIDRYDALAREHGAKIVTSCGFDSIPSDVGLWVLHQAAGEPLEEAVLAVDSMKGSFSGGTLASFVLTLDAARSDRARRKILADPYALSPDRAAEPDLGPQRDQQRLQRDAFVGGWTAPFVMGSINTRVVRRSNALSGYPYGRKLRYRETFALKSRPLSIVRGLAVPFGFLGVTKARRSALGRALVDRFLKKPGEGPSEEERQSGRLRMRMLGRTESGRTLCVRIAADGDPGYEATGRMLGEAGLALAFDGDRLPGRAGLLTPATALVPVLVDRLRSAGITFDLAGK